MDEGEDKLMNSRLIIGALVALIMLSSLLSTAASEVGAEKVDAYENDVYRKAPTTAQLATVTVNSHINWNAENITIRFNVP